MSESWIKKALALGICAASLGTSWCFWRWAAPRSRWDVFLGRKSAAEFLSHSDSSYYPSPSYPATEYLDNNAPADARVLFFGDSRAFYLTRDHIASSPMQVTILERMANASASGQELKARMDAQRISYIVVNHAEIVRLQLALHFSVAGKRSLDDFWHRYTLKVFQVGPEGERKDGRLMLDRWVVVYKVLSEAEAAQDHPRDDLFEAYQQRTGA